MKAASDLKLAIKGTAEDDDTLDSAIYHTQQCAEKALKGYIVFCKNILPRKTHDLTVLLKECIELDQTFKTFLRNVAELNPYATYFRYPDDYCVPDRTTTLNAIEKADKLLKFVNEKIAELNSGQNSIF